MEDIRKKAIAECEGSFVGITDYDRSRLINCPIKELEKVKHEIMVSSFHREEGRNI